MARNLKAVPDDEPADDGFDRRTITIKGTEYRLRELSSAEYDKAVKLSTPEDSDQVDTVQLLRWMISYSLEEPKLDMKGLGELSFKTLARLGAVVNDLHFNIEDDSDVEEDPDATPNKEGKRPNA